MSHRKSRRFESTALNASGRPGPSLRQPISKRVRRAQCADRESRTAWYGRRRPSLRLQPRCNSALRLFAGAHPNAVLHSVQADAQGLLSRHSEPAEPLRPVLRSFCLWWHLHSLTSLEAARTLFEMSRLGQSRSATADPVRDPGDHLICADAGTAKKLIGLLRVAEQSVSRFHALKANGLLQPCAKILCNLVHAEQFRPGDVDDVRRHRRDAE